MGGSLRAQPPPGLPHGVEEAQTRPLHLWGGLRRGRFLRGGPDALETQIRTRQQPRRGEASRIMDSLGLTARSRQIDARNAVGVWCATGRGGANPAQRALRAGACEVEGFAAEVGIGMVAVGDGDQPG